MKSVTVSWEPEHDRFTVLGGHVAHPIVVNAPHSGSATGFGASELLLAAVGTCSAWDVIEILRKQRQHVSGVQVAVTGEQATEPPWPFLRVRVSYQVRGQALARASVERAVALSIERYCSVVATVRAVASVETEIELIEETDDGTRVPAPDETASLEGSDLARPARSAR